MMKLVCIFRLLRDHRGLVRRFGSFGAGLLAAFSLQASTNVFLTEVPDYEWDYGCFGTATGNLMGFWDRHGYPNFYTGPTSGGVAPLNSLGTNASIRSLWASRAGVDGRPANQPGHVDDYFVGYGSTDPDPYLALGRREHEPDCLGDFIGLNQKRWKNLNGECDGNIDGYSFVYWDGSGRRRVNFTPGPEAGLPAIDIQSGLRAWTQFRGDAADVFTQLGDINPEVPRGAGFTYEDLKAEIDAGYPVLLFLQDTHFKSRSFPGMPVANPLIHGILAYGYYITDDGTRHVRYRSSFASGDLHFGIWKADTIWHGLAPLRGVIAYHPLPKITDMSESDGQVTIQWRGPNAILYDGNTGLTSKPHRYVVEMATSSTEADFVPITDPTTSHTVTIPAPDTQSAFYRVRLLTPLESED
jgi:hypothetical protein